MQLLALASVAIETLLSRSPGSSLVAVGGGAYADAFVHRLVGGVRAPAALGAQQLPRRGGRSSGSEHVVEEDNWWWSMTLRGTMIGRGAKRKLMARDLPFGVRANQEVNDFHTSSLRLCVLEIFAVRYHMSVIFFFVR